MESLHQKNTFNIPSRVQGLDTIRFLCAIWVLFGHGAAPQFPNPFEVGSFANLAFKGFFANIWSGPSAVIVFFVISGFCIHFPYAGSAKQPRLVPFYTRRFLRLLIPLVIAIPAGALMGVRLTLFSESILWSLFAELMYYLCYPLLRAAHLRLGSFFGMIIASFLLSLAVAATNPSAGNYASYGNALNWLLGLPCWLLGCMIADLVPSALRSSVSSPRIWALRLAVMAAACFCSALRFHSPIGYPWTLNVFAVLAAFWLYQEISFRNRNPAPLVLERAGAWSYSLYLLHLPAGTLFAKLFPELGNGATSWMLMIIFVLTICYGFYLLVERPSHNLAKALFPRTT